MFIIKFKHKEVLTVKKAPRLQVGAILVWTHMIAYLRCQTPA